MTFREYYIAPGNNRLNSVNTDSKITESQLNRNVIQQSIWEAEPLRTISYPTSQIQSTISTNLVKTNAWNELVVVQTDVKKSGTCSYYKPVLLGLIVGLLIGGIALAAIVTIWLTSTSTVTTTTATITSSDTTTTAFELVYSQNFTNGITPTTQCTAWTTFVAQLTVFPYTLLTMSGTLDPIGVTVIDPTVIANIALALRTSTAYGPVTSNGRSWQVGLCAGGYELSASGSICACPTTGYIVRPCIGNSNYGGINGTTCSAPTQTMTVTFQ